MNSRTLMAVIIAAFIMLTTTLHAQVPQSIPFSGLGEKAGADYAGDAIGIEATPAGYRLRAGFQKLAASVTSEGLWVESTDTDASRLRVVADVIGRVGSESAASIEPSGVISKGKSVVSFARKGITEEYSVSVDGVRQDFLVLASPSGHGDLVLQLKVDGARASAISDGVSLKLNGSGRELIYHRLSVTDSTGRKLNAALDVMAANRIAVRVDDSAAVYPVRIDPTFSDADWVSLNPNPNLPGTNGDVFAIALDASGNLYIGGTFTRAGGVVANNIAKWNGTVWSALGSGINSRVWSLAVIGSDLYAGGEFTAAGGIAANRIAKWSGTAWSALGSGTNGVVTALAASGGNLYVGGITSAGGVAVNGIARWSGSAWSALGSGVSAGAVFSLAVNGSDVYAGGTFLNAGGAPANRIAKWNGTTWSPLGSGTNGNVLALAVNGSDVYAGGDFTTAGGIAANNIAKWNGTAWSALGTGLNGTVESLAVGAGNLYATNTFQGASGAPDSGFRTWNGTNWGNSTNIDGAGAALAVSAGGDVYAAGKFTSISYRPAYHIAKRTGSTWSGLGGSVSTVLAAAAIGHDFYVAGSFSNIAGVPANHIAKWNGSNWSALGAGTDGGIHTLAVIGGDLFAAGYFSEAGGIPVDGIAKWNGTQWTALGAGYNGFIVTALTASGTDLYAVFTDGSTDNFLKKWDGTQWSVLGPQLNGPNGIEVRALAVIGTDVYAGGMFDEIGGVAARGVAKWNGTEWSRLGSGLLGQNESGVAMAFAAIGGDLYVGGYFLSAGGEPTQSIAKWNGSLWAPVGGEQPQAIFEEAIVINQLAVSGTDLYVGGSFSVIDRPLDLGPATEAHNIARWNGTEWSALGSGTSGPGIDYGSGLPVSGPVTALATDAFGHLFVGGNFLYAGTTLSPFVAQANLGLRMVVEAPAGSAIPDGGSASAFPGLLVGTTGTPRTFTIRNNGDANVTSLAVTLDGGNAADFLVNTAGMSTTLIPGATTTFSVTFAPGGTASSVRTATLHIASNVPEVNPHDITITGTGFHPSSDSDADGLGDWAEDRFASLGFNWQTNQSALVTTLSSNANLASLFTQTQYDANRVAGQNDVTSAPNTFSLYTTSQIQALNVGTPLIQRNASTGAFTLTLGVRKSTNLITFEPFPMTAPQTTISGEGKLEFQFTVPDNAAFFRIEAR